MTLQEVVARFNTIPFLFAGSVVYKDGKQGKMDFPVLSASVPAGGEAWKQCWKNHRESYRLSFSLGRLPFRKTILGRKVVSVVLPDTGKEIIKSSDTRSVPERETAEDGIKRVFPEHAAPDGDGSHFQP